jgi:hypothetical protein
MNQVMKSPEPERKLSRRQQLIEVTHKAVQETGVTVSDHQIISLLHGRDDIMSGDLAHGMRICEGVGSWLGWRMGGTPKYGWPSNARRPDLPQDIQRKAAT